MIVITHVSRSEHRDFLDLKGADAPRLNNYKIHWENDRATSYPFRGEFSVSEEEALEFLKNKPGQWVSLEIGKYTSGQIWKLQAEAQI